ncbi:unnamed protein product, partial [Sphacelaria rigidula]
MAFYRFYGVQYGIECWCGVAGIDYARHGNGICDIPCRGDASIMCGGTFSFEIFPFPNTMAPTPAPTL